MHNAACLCLYIFIFTVCYTVTCVASTVTSFMWYFHTCINHHFIIVKLISVSIHIYNNPHFSLYKFKYHLLVTYTFHPYVNSYTISNQSHINQFMLQATFLSIHIHIHIYIYRSSYSCHALDIHHFS